MHGPSRQLERFLAAFSRDLPDRAVPGDLGIRKDQFNQINKKTGHRIRYLKVDAETGEEVSNEDIIKGYQVDKEAPPSNVYNLMDALRASIKGGQRTPAEKPAKDVKKSKSAKPATKRRKAG